MRDPPHETAGKRSSLFGVAGVVLGGVGFAGVAASAIGYRLTWWPVGTALTFAQWAFYSAALGLATSLIGAVLCRTSLRAFLAGLIGVAVAMPVVAMGVRWEYAARTYPPINDISTDTEDAPVFRNMPNPTAYPVRKQPHCNGPPILDLDPLIVSIAPARAYALAKSLATEQGWEIVADDPNDGRIEAVDRSVLFGFKD